MKDKVKNGTEKYPDKRGYAIGKLQKFLKLSNLTKKFKNNCKRESSRKGQTDLHAAFIWSQTYEGLNFWIQVEKDFEHYCNGNKVFTVYGD